MIHLQFCQFNYWNHQNSLPELLTVPFLFLSEFCFVLASKTAQNWLTNRPRFDQSTAYWQKRAIKPQTKITESITIAARLLISVSMGIPTKRLIIKAVTLPCVSTFIWSRPNA